MKELEQKKIDKAEVVRQVAKQTAVNSWKHYRGHKVWELNVKEGLIREATGETVAAQ